MKGEILGGLEPLGDLPATGLHPRIKESFPTVTDQRDSTGEGGFAYIAVEGLVVAIGIEAWNDVPIRRCQQLIPRRRARCELKPSAEKRSN